jgi:hypothetical protein
VGRGTAVDSDTVVDSKAASVSDCPDPADFLRISDANIVSRVPLSTRNPRQIGTLWTPWLKERFIG